MLYIYPISYVESENAICKVMIYKEQMKKNEDDIQGVFDSHKDTLKRYCFLVN